MSPSSSSSLSPNSSRRPTTWGRGRWGHLAVGAAVGGMDRGTTVGIMDRGAWVRGGGMRREGAGVCGGLRWGVWRWARGGRDRACGGLR
ncbi:hypothetical protein GUJ93_ZPchr0024g29079 [Zizania palustris]|uniref:Uncharacterized protein n=1 Tax=Zizania palustris TaxID=103762 RepID=A0A8J5QZN3_ZIZPA|nr:hypothetical protein GUJ93_ZPchr0024g29079 [Zizania palustris]